MSDHLVPSVYKPRREDKHTMLWRRFSAEGLYWWIQTYSPKWPTGFKEKYTVGIGGSPVANFKTLRECIAFVRKEAVLDIERQIAELEVKIALRRGVIGNIKSIVR